MRSAWLGALGLICAIFAGCGDDETASSGGDEALAAPVGDGPICNAICQSNLTVGVGAGLAMFSVTLSGAGLDPVTATCPDTTRDPETSEVEVTCEAEAVRFSMFGQQFPLDVMVTVDAGTAQMFTPNYTDSELCGSTCNDAMVMAN